MSGSCIYINVLQMLAKHCGPSVDAHKQARKKIACHLSSHLSRIFQQKNGTYGLPPKLLT